VAVVVVGVVLGAATLLELVEVVDVLEVVLVAGAVVVCAADVVVFEAVVVVCDPEPVVCAEPEEPLEAAVFAAVLEAVVRALEACAIACTEAVVVVEEEEPAFAPAVVCEPMAVEVWPWKSLAATTASAPDSVAAAATIPRVIARIRRRPRSRVRIARRVVCSERLRVGVRRGLIAGRSRPARGVCRRSSSIAIVGWESETPLRRA